MLELKAPPEQQVGPCRALPVQCVSWQAQAGPGQKTYWMFDDKPAGFTFVIFLVLVLSVWGLSNKLHLAQFNGGEAKVLTVARVKSAEVADKAPAEPAFDRVCTNMTNQGV